MKNLILSSVILALLWFSPPVPGLEDEDLLIGMPQFPKVGIPSTLQQVNEGARLLAEGESVTAEALLGQALLDNPLSAEAAYNFGLALAFNGQWENALQPFSKALELRPTFPEAHLAVGTTYLSTGNAESALEAFTRAIEMNPTEAVLHAATFNKGVALGRLHRFSEAELCLAESLALAPDDPSPAFQLGRLQMQQEKWQEGADWLEATIHDLPLESHTLRTRAFLKLNQPDKAAASLQLAQTALQEAVLADTVRAEVASRLNRLAAEIAAAKSGP